MTYRKKLIEVALPLKAINKESLRRKQKAPKGWPTSFHKWWAQRPLAAARAVIFAQIVDDPSSYPDLFPSEKIQKKERNRLLGIIEDLIKWDNTANEEVLQRARDEIWQSWRRACADNAAHSLASTLFSRDILPEFFDPFTGSGSIPLSAQWLGFVANASDLNPVAVLINKAMIEIPPRFKGKPPINPQAREDTLIPREWENAQGLAEDVRYYGQWMCEEAKQRIGHLYPKVEITEEMTKERSDLKKYLGRNLTVISWIWARTVKSPNPAFANVEVPLASTFMLSAKKGREAYVEPLLEGHAYRFTVKIGKPKNANVSIGTKSRGSGSSFLCLMSGTPMPFAYLRSEAKAGRMGIKLMAVVAAGDRGRIYLPPTQKMETVALHAKPTNVPENDLPKKALGFRVQEYGMTKWRDLFTPRQLVSLTTFSDLVYEAVALIRSDAIAANFAFPADDRPLREGGTGATAYAEAIATYLACILDRMAYYGSSLTTWLPKDNALRDCMPRQALAMVWDFAEANPFGKSSGDAITCTQSISNYLDVSTPYMPALITQIDAQALRDCNQSYLISTDPPYYDNIGYADLSDYFYIWLRRSLHSVFPDLFATVAVPKADELVATPYRHGSKEKAETFFLNGMTKALQCIANKAIPGFPVTIYYAFKQSESKSDVGTVSTGWETFLDAVWCAGFAITGTWPLRTEGAGRMVASGTNALASSIVLVCRPRVASAPTATRREFVSALKKELPTALVYLQSTNIAPVDLAQAAIGPGMAVYTRYSKVLDAKGNLVTVREALSLINQVLDEALAEQEGDFDADTRLALTWFEQQGFDEGEFGVAEQLSKSKNTSVAGMVEAGILESKRGKVRLLRPEELPADWDPLTEKRLTVWEIVHHLIRVLESGGESAASELVSKLGAKAEIARELAYRLYVLCERKKRAAEALAYNGLVQSWPEIIRLSREVSTTVPRQGDLFGEIED